MRKYFCTDIHLNSTVSGKEFIVFDCLEHFGKFITEEDGYYSRRSLVCTEPVVVSGTCNRNTKQISVVINCFDNSYKEYKELCIFSWCFARIQKVDSGVCAHGPVIVFTTAVDSFEWFFMKQANHVVFCCNFFHDFHSQLVVIDSNICCIKYRSKLMLCRSNFIMFRFCRNTEFPELFVQIMHVSCNTWLQSSEIVIFHFLSFRSRSTDQCTSAEDQVLSLIVEVFVYKKIFLLRTYGCVDVFDFCIAKKTKNLNSLFI